MSEDKPFSYEHCEYRICCVVENFLTPLNITTYLNKLRLLDKQKKELVDIAREVENVLYPHKTSKTLLEAWPECEKYLLEVFGEDESAPMLPATNIVSLNDRIGKLNG